MKINNLSFVILGIILVVFAFWSATDTSFSSLKGIEHQETLKKINQCENSKTDNSFETYMTISSQFDVDWSDCDLTGVILRHVSLVGANLSGADLTGADFGAANLSNANLSGADLSDADLTGANLDATNLSGATRCNTVMPDKSVIDTGC